MSLKNLKLTTFINLYGLFKIPLVLFVNPRVVESSEDKFVLKIPLAYRTKNHMGSMYFGALGIGAELSIAAAAVVAIAESKQKIDFIFKDFKAEYLKRGSGDVHFILRRSSRRKISYCRGYDFCKPLRKKTHGLCGGARI